MPAKKAPKSRLVPQRELAEWLNLSTVWVRTLERQGTLPARQPRGYDLKKCVTAYAIHLQEINRATGNGVGDDPDSEELNLDRYTKQLDARLKEQKLDGYARRLIDAAADELAGRLGERLSSLRATIQRMKLTKEQKAKLRAGIDRAIKTGAANV